MKSYDSLSEGTPLLVGGGADAVVSGDSIVDEMFRITNNENRSNQHWKSAEQMTHSKRRYDIFLMTLLWIIWLLLGWLFYMNSTCCDGRWGAFLVLLVVDLHIFLRDVTDIVDGFSAFLMNWCYI
jgi:hypothetical protein